MAQEVRGMEWREYHDSTNYPFSDRATLTNGDDFIGEGVFLDAVFYPVGVTERLFLSQVSVRDELITLYIGDQNRSVIASASFSDIDPPDSLQFVDSYNRPAGLIVSDADRLATFQSWILGDHNFTADQTEFSARVCFPTPEIGVRGFLLDDGSVVSDDAWIIGEEGVVVREETSEVDAPGFTGETISQRVIRVDIVGDPLFRRQLCSDIFTTPRFLEQVTFKHGCRKVVCGPDEFGDLKVSVSKIDREDTILRIRATPGGLVFEAIGEKLDSLL